MTTIVIRDIESLDEMHEVEQLQREIWGVEDLEIYPALALKPQKEVGATLIGAFAEGRMVDVFPRETFMFNLKLVKRKTGILSLNARSLLDTCR